MISCFVLSRYVSRVANADDDTMETLHQAKLQKKARRDEEKVKSEIKVDPVDCLPVKTLDGKLHFQSGKTLKQFYCCLVAHFSILIGGYFILCILPMF